jgi:hypothetical protein
MTQETGNEAAQAPEKGEGSRLFRVEVHLHSGKTVTFDAIKFDVETRGGKIVACEWEFTPRMSHPGVRRPMLDVLDFSRVEAVEITELLA